ncbi:MAG: L-lysine 6-transaminase [Balneolaceae bacterium]
MTQLNRLKTEEIHDLLDRHILADGYDMVLDLQKSQGARLYDSVSGDTFLDFYTFFASNPLGMNHEKLAGDAAFVEKLGRAALNKPSNSDIYTRELAEFVQTFHRIAVPDYFKYMFFIDGGALAVENALKVAFDWKVQKNYAKGYRTEKGHKVLHLEQAFHGRSGYTLSLTNTTDPKKTRYFPKFEWPRIPNPTVVHPAEGGNLDRVIEKEKRAIARAEHYFEEYEDEIACIILEPIQGEGGDNHFRPEFHQALRDLADRHDALLIYDEVQTGVGLTGKFWCHEHFVRPDIISFGKKTQVCGILVTDRIDDVEENCFNVSSRINSTWGGNLTDMVRFARILEVIKEEDLVGNAEKRGHFLQKGLEDLTDREEPLTNPRGRGLFCAVDLPDRDIRDRVLKMCRKNRLLLLGCGERSIRFRPPLTIADEELEEGLQIIEKSLKSVLAGQTA